MLTLPNLLTLSRIFAVPLLVFLLWPTPKPFDYFLAFALYCLMGITDYFDGYLARAKGTVSRLGVFLDPIADKIMVAAVIVMLVFIDDIRTYHIIAALVISAPTQCDRSISSWPETPGKKYLLPPENPTTSCGNTGPTTIATSASAT